MGFERMAFDPVSGLNDSTEYPTTPANETAARKQIQDVLDELRDALNALQVELEKATAGDTGASKIGLDCSLGANVELALKTIEAAGTGSIPPDASLTVAKFVAAAFSTDGTFADNSDTKVASQKAIKTYAMPASYLDTDDTLAANSDTKVPSQKAVKTYANNMVPITAVSADGTMADNSDAKVPTQKAAKTYSDTKIANSIIDAKGDLIVGSAADTAVRKAIGSAFQLLRVNAAGDDLEYSSWINVYSASDVILLSATTERTTNATDYTKLKECVVNGYGTLRILFSIKEAGGTCYGRIYRNGVAVGTDRTGNSGYQVFSEDIAGWSPGDLLQIYCKNSDGGGNVTYVNDHYVKGTESVALKVITD